MFTTDQQPVKLAAPRVRPFHNPAADVMPRIVFGPQCRRGAVTLKVASRGHVVRRLDDVSGGSGLAAIVDDLRTDMFATTSREGVARACLKETRGELRLSLSTTAD